LTNWQRLSPDFLTVAVLIRRREPRPGGLPFSRSDSERLIKQTYSVHVSLPDDRPRGVTRKWHLTAYFSQTTLDGLGTIDDIPGVGDLRVPEGWFKSARASKAKRPEPNSGDEMSSAQDPWGLGAQPSPRITQFPVDPASAAQDMHLIGPSSYASPVPQSVSPYSYAPPPQSLPGNHVLAATHSLHYGAPHPAPRLPNLHDSGLRNYRDPSPLEFSSSNVSSSSSSSDPDYSPRPFTSPLTPPTPSARPMLAQSQSERGMRGPRDLVPLDVLQGTSRPTRNPVDEQFLRRFSTSVVASPDIPRPWSSARQHGSLDNEDMKPRMPLRSEW